MKLPTMEELHKFYATTVAKYPLEVCTSTHEFNIEVAFYHGWMAALSAVKKSAYPNVDKLVDELADVATSGIAATIGG